MSQGRPPRPIGVPGKVDLTEIQTGVWQALVRVRNATGKRRKVKHVSPAKQDSRGRLIPDKEGMRARDAVLAAASALTTSPLNANLNPNTTIQALYYDHYRTYLIAQDKAPATLDRYDIEAKALTAAFGNRRLNEATTQMLETYLTSVADTRGPGAANRPERSC